MKLELLSSLVITAVSFIAIIISFFTLQEMKEQRKMEVMPLLYVKNYADAVILPSYNCDSIPYTNELEFLDRDVNNQSQKYLEILNLGRGPALEVTVHWDFNFSWINDFIKEEKIDTKFINLVTNGDMLTVAFNACYGGEAVYTYVTDHNKRLGQLPSSMVSQTLNSGIPRELYEIPLAFIRAARITNGISPDYNESLIITGILNTTYKSIYDNEVSRSYEVIIDLAPSGFTSHSSSEGETIFKISDSYILSIEINERYNLSAI